MKSIASVLSTCALAVALSPTMPAQLADLQPGRNFVAEPNFGGEWSQSADAGDVDRDGDLDVAVANGGEGPLKLPRIFMNDGTGSFTDETAARFIGFLPLAGRDIEFFDAENDGDLDFMIASSSTSGLNGAVSRFYANLGGVQQGAAGFFEEGTDSFWGALVSVPPASQVFGGNAGPFKEFSLDCDFNDLDDDGDLDLLFSTYGPLFALGTRDSRVFLNDGLGTFNELWPWADVGADTSWATFDIDLADCDGDFDLDLAVESYKTPSRVFLNNLYGTSLGPRAFHEITTSALIDTGAFSASSQGYEAEYGDADGDGDFDLWMGDYDGNIDRLLRNDGPSATGFGFTKMTGWIQGEPSTDSEEADFGDYDCDGDLDVFVANFSGTNYLYQSSVAQGDVGGGLYHRSGLATGLAPQPELPSNFNGGNSFDGEWFDLDEDGDLDIVMTTLGSQGNWMFRNVLGVPDTHAPGFAGATLQPDKPNGTPTVIHAAVRDNAPLQLHRYYGAALVYSVDGGAPQSTPMLAQGGQQYRGVIPAQTDATIEYHVEVTDLAGNTGTSSTHAFFQGDNLWTDLGSGLAGIAGVPSLAGTGPLTAGSAGALTLTSAAPSAICALFVSVAGTAAPFKCGTLVPVPVAIQLTLVTNGAGALPLAWGSWPSGLSGASLYFQYAIADGAAVCGTALSNAIKGDVP